MNTTDQQQSQPPEPQTTEPQTAEPEDAKALHEQGIKHAAGIDGPKDYPKAAECYRRAAEQEYAPAQYNLGMLYRIGWGVTQDRDKAIEWWHRAAENGDPEAMTELGSLSFDASKYQEAIKWWRRAAEQGHAFAQYLLARAADKGWVGKPDLVEAHAWYHLSTESGFSPSDFERRVLALRLTPEQMTESQNRIRQYAPKTTKPNESAT